ncbi:type II secretion system protein [Gemmatimonas sp.]|jgi:prepilin-type N-terminal cleavage/methylation domain-containing protein|uniref:type II secretion system protein n=1 Tax=Gemmatimonas sp. TaxID=1962908 RepID=UPI0022BAA570|nr:type II secretion system protein [Gemmatimonas sp.]MCA2985023.1 type II secretion system protein [Gemmatimonas sp.]MCA2986022.1 type II secretion system protein [Gemmatimonas sp.]MCA2989922.1 type II secretion system protein [Gemmatimonas sp.]MCA2995728.1 type II secretion system protein [Gemmatimonas sp.]MCE2953996.1 type II secretion system GspH family protein [Gemmatimonas sp.]
MTGTRARPGFTLLEVAVVLAITVIGGLLVLPRWNRPLATDAAGADALFDGDAPGTLLARTLLLARGHAIATRQVVTVRFDVANRTMRADTSGAAGSGVWHEGPLPLAAGESLEPGDLLTSVTFHPSGAAFGESLRVRHGEGWVAVHIDALSGDVSRHAY